MLILQDSALLSYKYLYFVDSTEVQNSSFTELGRWPPQLQVTYVFLLSVDSTGHTGEMEIIHTNSKFRYKNIQSKHACIQNFLNCFLACVNSVCKENGLFFSPLSQNTRPINV